MEIYCGNGNYCNDEILSSIVNDGIREFYTFLREDPTRTKSTRSTKNDFLHLRCFSCAKKSTKSTRCQTSDFFLLDVFYVHRNAVFFIFIGLCPFWAFYAKQATFFLLDVFYAHLKLSLFLFVYARFELFVCVGSFRKRYKTP